MLSLVTLAAALAGTVAAASSPELAATRAGRRHLPSHRRLQAAPRSSLRRGLQSTVATLQMCPPAIGSDSVIYADVYDLPNLQDYRGVLLISPDGNQWWDKTCGMNGHPACDDTDPMVQDATPTTSTAPGFRVWRVDLGDDSYWAGIFSAIPYVTYPGDNNAVSIALFMVPAGQVASMADPNGGPLPQSLYTAAAVYSIVDRRTATNCTANSAPPTDLGGADDAAGGNAGSGTAGEDSGDDDGGAAGVGTAGSGSGTTSAGSETTNPGVNLGINTTSGSGAGTTDTGTGAQTSSSTTDTSANQDVVHANGSDSIVMTLASLMMGAVAAVALMKA